MKSNSSYVLLWLYLSVLFWISIGVMAEGQWQDLFYIAGYVAVVTAAFVVFKKIEILLPLGEKVPQTRVTALSRPLTTFFMIAFIFVITVISIQLTILGKIPVFLAAQSNDSREITLIRQQIVLETPSVVNYLTSFCIRAILPLLVMFTLIKKRNGLFYIAVFLGTFFCCSLMQKSYIALVFVPSILMALMLSEWKKAIVLLVISAFSVYLLINITNPQNRLNCWKEHVAASPPVTAPVDTNVQNTTSATLSLPEERSTYIKQMSTLIGLADRVVIRPGQVVAEWFSLIPSQLPFGNGCGDRVLAKILHCDPINYSERIYALLFSEQLNDHIVGTVNAASFMEWYANFGWPGLLIAGLELGFFLAFVSVLLKQTGPVLLVVNAPFIFLLSSVSFHTLLLSGGWALSILLVYLLRQAIRPLACPHKIGFTVLTNTSAGVA